MVADVILEAKDVYKDYSLKRRNPLKKQETVKAVRGVSFHLMKEEAFGCVGESGCGKSTLSRLLIMLEKPTKGEIFCLGKNTSSVSRKEKHQLRRKIQLVLQDPYLSLPSWMKVGDIVGDPLKIHEKNTTTKNEKKEKVLKSLAEVGLERDSYDRYPLSFSAGQRQMINIARAIILNPEIIILDEAVSALDVSVQAHILNLFSNLKENKSLSYVIIAHDIGVVRHMCDRICVMYLGRIIELGKNDDLFGNPLHPYTLALLNSVPTIDDGLGGRTSQPLTGEVPSPINIPIGCSFKLRCPKAMKRCDDITPELVETIKGHFVECHLFS